MFGCGGDAPTKNEFCSLASKPDGGTPTEESLRAVEELGLRQRELRELTEAVVRKAARQ